MQSDLRSRIRENLIMLDTYHTIISNKVCELGYENIGDLWFDEEFWHSLDAMQSHIVRIADLCGLDYDGDIYRNSTIRASGQLDNKEEDE